MLLLLLPLLLLLSRCLGDDLHGRLDCESILRRHHATPPALEHCVSAAIAAAIIIAISIAIIIAIIGIDGHPHHSRLAHYHRPCRHIAAVLIIHAIPGHG